MSKNSLISVIVPVFNESENIEELHERTRKVFSEHNQLFEFIAIDDGSTDDSYEKLAKLRERYPNIAIIRHRRNHGKSMSLMQGFSLAKGEIAITMDADLQDEPENIPQILSKLSEGYDLVNGWRINRKDAFSRRFASKIFNFIIRSLLKTHLHDINCGLKALKKDFYKRLELRGDLHRLIPALGVSYGFAVTEVPVTHAERKHGLPKYKLIRHRGLLDVISLMTLVSFRFRPFHIFSEMAFISLTFSIIFLIGLIVTVVFFPLTSAWHYALSIFLIFAILATLIIGLIFPIVGLLIDIFSVPLQNDKWRKKLIKETLESKLEKNG